MIYDPNRNDLFTATRGSGVPEQPPHPGFKTTKMRDALIGTGFPFRDGAAFDEYVTQFKNLMPKTAGLRRPLGGA